MNRGTLERSHIYQSISISWEPQRNKARNFKHLVHQTTTQPLSSVLHEPPHLKGLIISHMHYVLLSELNTVGSAHGVIVLIWKCLWLITSVYFPCWRSMELIPCSVLADLFQKNKKIKEPEPVLKLSSISKMLARQALGLELDPNNPCKRPGMCWRVDSVVKNTCCSSRGPKFNSEHLCGHSQPLIIPVPKNLMPSSDFCGHQTYTWYTDHASWTYTIKLKILFFKVRHGGAC